MSGRWKKLATAGAARNATSVSSPDQTSERTMTASLRSSLAGMYTSASATPRSVMPSTYWMNTRARPTAPKSDGVSNLARTTVLASTSTLPRR